ncbi:EpsG family protein [Citrobacter gillenii]|uniref:EpsG family protein n=1 Tax=Citrobacter gillenii TaxID=67828 RepID=UPI00311CC9F2
MALKNNDMENDISFKYKNNNMHMFLFNRLFVLIIIILFFIYPLILLPVIAVISPFVNNQIRIFFSLLSVVFFSLFYSSITPFSDIAEYVLIYRNIMDINIFSFGRFGGGIEILILFIMRVVYFISDGNEYAFLLACFTLIQILLFLFCWRVNPKLSCLYFLIFNLSYAFYAFNAYFLRSMLSVVFLINAFLLYNKKKYAFYFLSIISHLSSVLYIGVWEFIKARNTKIKAIVLALAAILVVVCIISLRDRIEYYLFYSNGNSMGYVQALTIVINYLFCFLLLFYSNTRTELTTKRMFLFLTFFLLLGLVSYKVPQNFGIRISLFIYALSPFFIYPLLMSSRVYTSSKIFALNFVLLVNCLFFFIILYKGDDVSFYIFENPFDATFIDILRKNITSFSSGYYSIIYTRA